MHLKKKFPFFLLFVCLYIRHDILFVPTTKLCIHTYIHTYIHTCYRVPRFVADFSNLDKTRWLQGAVRDCMCPCIWSRVCPCMCPYMCPYMCPSKVKGLGPTVCVECLFLRTPGCHGATGTTVAVSEWAELGSWFPWPVTGRPVLVY